MARFKGDGPLRFTRSSTAEQLTAELVKAIPVDMVYCVVPNPDGSGYSLREVGPVTLDILPSSPNLVMPHTPPAFTAVEGDREDNDPQRLASSPPSQPATFVSHIPPVVSHQVDKDPFESDQPYRFPVKSQAELLAERGIVETPPARSVATPAKKRSRKAKPAPLDAAPRKVISNSTRQVTGFTTATPAEAAAASNIRTAK